MRSLTKKVGPLPVWAYGLIVIVGALAFKFLHKGGGTTADTSTPADNQASLASSSPDYGAQDASGGGTSGGDTSSLYSNSPDSALIQALVDNQGNALGALGGGLSDALGVVGGQSDDLASVASDSVNALGDVASQQAQSSADLSQGIADQGTQATTALGNLAQTLAKGLTSKPGAKRKTSPAAKKKASTVRPKAKTPVKKATKATPRAAAPHVTSPIASRGATTHRLSSSVRAPSTKVSPRVVTGPAVHAGSGLPVTTIRKTEAPKKTTPKPVVKKKK